MTEKLNSFSSLDYHLLHLEERRLSDFMPWKIYVVKQNIQSKVMKRISISYPDISIRNVTHYLT
jgi:hypothetical protein